VELALKVGRAAAAVLSGAGGKIIVGRDTRISSSCIECAVSAGVCSAGANSVLPGVVPTPAVSFLAGLVNADAGIMISASHNSFEFNGIKIFGKNGLKLTDEIEEKIENLIISNFKEYCNFPSAKNIGGIIYENNFLKSYAEYISSITKKNMSLKIAFDCANGSAVSCAEKIFNKKFNSEFIFNNPDGININKNCGSTDLKALSCFVTKNKFDLGIAFDGDADRCLAVDETGAVIDGDEIMAICALDMLENKKLVKNAVVGTEMANIGFVNFLKKSGIDFFQTKKIGDRYVLNEMTKNGFMLGGEQSGHIIFLNHSKTGDGLLTAAMFINAFAKRGIKASEIKKLFKKFPQITKNIKIDKKNENITENPDFKNTISKIEKLLKGCGRIFIRKSGTEPILRIMCECESRDKLKEISEMLNELEMRIVF
jgi:phosphoglucosamine mutase